MDAIVGLGGLRESIACALWRGSWLVHSIGGFSHLIVFLLLVIHAVMPVCGLAVLR